MTADKFGAEYAKYQDVAIDDAAHDREQIAIMSEALRESWAIFDKLGAHQSDEHRIAVIHSPEFASAAYRVRTAMLKTARET